MNRRCFSDGTRQVPLITPVSNYVKEMKIQMEPADQAQVKTAQAIAGALYSG